MSILSLKKVRQSFAKRSLESELAQIITIAEEHKSVGLEPKHSYYKRLQTRAFDVISAYTKEYGGTNDDIVMSVPKLKELGDLADGTISSQATMYIGGLIGLLVLGTFISAYLGVLHRIYTLVAH